MSEEFRERTLLRPIDQHDRGCAGAYWVGPRPMFRWSPAVIQHCRNCTASRRVPVSRRPVRKAAA